MMNCGVYKIAAPNGEFYAGSSADLKSRERGHFRALRKGKHHSILLQRAWKKYGGRLEFSVMLVCDAKAKIAAASRVRSAASIAKRSAALKAAWARRKERNDKQ